MSYNVEARLPLQMVLDAIPKTSGGKPKVLFPGCKSPVSVTSSRLIMYKIKGVKCAMPGCKREGAYWHVESSGSNNMHLNLYAADGVMMTQDHIVAKSEGGEDKLYNKQPMCARCNGKKASKDWNEVKNTALANA